jgi:hypothetical protein
MGAPAPVDAERVDRRRAHDAFARYALVRAHPETDAGKDAEGHNEAERLRDDLVVAYLSLARYLAAKFANRGEPLDDLIQVATLGLLKAIDRFDLERGVEFTTYATPASRAQPRGEPGARENDRRPRPLADRRGTCRAPRSLRRGRTPGPGARPGL